MVRHSRPHPWTGRSRGAALVLAAALAVSLAGCGGERVPDVGPAYPIQGKVTLPDGKPLARVKVIFSGPVSNNAITDGDGTFALKGAGLPAGDYKVSLEVAETRGSARRSLLPFPEKYHDEDTSDLRATVKPDGPNDFDFKLTKSDTKKRG